MAGKGAWFAAATSGALAVSVALGVSAQGVYRCTDADGGVLYADAPCGGVKLDLRPGKADPAAVARLQREQEKDRQRQAEREQRRQAMSEAVEFERELRREVARAEVVVPPPGAGDVPWWFYGGAPQYLPAYPPLGIGGRPGGGGPPARPVAPPASVVPASPAVAAPIGR